MISSPKQAMKLAALIEADGIDQKTEDAAVTIRKLTVALMMCIEDHIQCPKCAYIHDDCCAAKHGTTGGIVCITGNWKYRMQNVDSALLEQERDND
jgi:hypothetical protein